jgi:DNA-binding NarL/FixJ family response regulator
MAVRALTATEERVARLVADGLSNPQVAAELGLTLSSVEWHLWRAFRKLGTHSRAELADRLSNEGSLE